MNPIQIPDQSHHSTKQQETTRIAKHMNCKATITVVLSTYNRPDTLQAAIESVLIQDYPHWKLLVIGDQCDKRTKAVVSTFVDTRIHYINLPSRFGEQSGPNSVGIALADTDYLTFLNHDDLLFPDHLSYGLAQLREKEVDFFLGMSAFAYLSVPTEDGAVRPVFHLTNHTGTGSRYEFVRRIQQVPHSFEPSSAWILRTKVAKRVGYWHSRNLFAYRTPLDDWVARAWRQGTSFAFGDRLTVLKITTHHQERYRSGQGVYAHRSLEHDYLLPRLKQNHQKLRLDISSEIQAAQQRRHKSRPWLNTFFQEGKQPKKILRNAAKQMKRTVYNGVFLFLRPAISRIYLVYGTDIVDRAHAIIAIITRTKKHDRLQAVVERRTGETISAQLDTDTWVHRTMANLNLPMDT